MPSNRSEKRRDNCTDSEKLKPMDWLVTLMAPSEKPTPRRDLTQIWFVSVTAPVAEIVSAYSTRPSRSVYGCPPTRRGPLMFRSRISTPLIALRYRPSTVSTNPYGSNRSNPPDSPKYCGYLKFGSVRLTPTVPARPAGGGGCPRHAVGSAFTSIVNTGTESLTPPVQLSRTRPSPVLAYALPSMM